jgi:hypothetical protein
MHGLINRSIQCFVADSYGKSAWREIAAKADIGHDNFEAMLTYDAPVTRKVIQAAAAHLDIPPEMFLEDIGTYLVSNPRMAAARRLLRLGGDTFLEFLYSLDDLHDRARLAVADLDFPQVELLDQVASVFRIELRHPIQGFGMVFVGALRALADDYGALVVIEHQGGSGGVETISVELLETDFAEGREFELAEGA